MTTFPATIHPLLTRLLFPSAIAALVGLGYLLHSETPGPDDLSRLQSIPLEQRRVFWKKLQAFDRLPRPDRRAIENLDHQIQEMPPEERNRYLATLHRYAVWLRSQPAERQAELAGLEIDDRLARLRLYWAEGQPGRDQESMATFFQSAALSPLGLIDSAFLLRIWFAITPEERRQVQAIKTLDARIQRLKSRADELRIDRDYGPLRDRFEAIKSQAPPNAAIPRLRFGKALEAQGMDLALFRRLEAWYFVNHAPRAVPPNERARFDAVLPDWFRDTTVALPADVARRRLDLLYELVFGAEGMPADLKPDPRPKPTSAPSSRPTNRPSSGAGNVPL